MREGWIGGFSLLGQGSGWISTYHITNHITKTTDREAGIGTNDIFNGNRSTVMESQLSLRDDTI